MYLPHIEVLRPEFRQLVLMNTHLEKLWTGGRWLEGPAWFGAERFLVFSDIPNNRMMRFDETDGSVSVFRQPSMHSNGNTRDRQGRLITCEHSGRRVTRTEYDGSIIVLADQYHGNKLNSPNDVVVASDDSIWFTDPTYGIDSDYEGARHISEIGQNNVYRIDPITATVKVVCTDLVQPNGLSFSLDESTLYVSDTGATHRTNGPRHIRQFSVDNETLVDRGVLATCSEGLFDGFRIDEQGNIWSSSAAGVECINQSGELIGRIKVPETVANVCFGGAKRNRLFICATTSLFATYLNICGA
jgi:gluconolactonase